MKVKVRLFAGLADLVGARMVEVDLRNGATVADLREELARQYPAVAPFMATLVCAVNEEYVPSDQRVSEGDEIALIPPVSGGARCSS
jgi:molybdopterin converting factor subunit 1